jgi:hypothetical protein
MARISTSSSLPRVPRVVAAALIAVALAAGISSTTGATASASTPTVPAPEPTTAPEPEPTTAPQPEPTTATPTVPDVTIAPEASDDDSNWLPIVLILVGGIALVALVAMVLVRRSPSPETGAARRPTAQAAPVASPQTDLLNTSQWIHDQFSMQVLAATPETALARWSVERSRLDNVAIGAHQLFLEGGGEMWQRLEQVMTLLATSIDTNVQLRSQVPPNVQLVTESANVVNQHRATLQQAINVLRASLPR